MLIAYSVTHVNLISILGYCAENKVHTRSRGGQETDQTCFWIGDRDGGKKETTPSKPGKIHQINLLGPPFIPFSSL